MADKPYYPHKPIASVETLAKTLGINLPLLISVSQNTQTSYTSFTIPTKSKDRIVHEPKRHLKYIQKKINNEILSKVEHPKYLMGGIKDTETPRDYLENSKQHLRKEHLINVDIENFYHSIKKNHVEYIFRNLFKFPPEVTSILASIVTFNGEVPQGACTSSYIANLIFFNTEYAIVSKLKSKKISYTRLLDDITISSNGHLNNNDKTWIVSEISGMVKKYGLRLKASKTRIEERKNIHASYEVTGSWVRFGEPKLKKSERNKIRHQVYICEKLYAQDPTTESYHAQWNKVSGIVAKLSRFSHHNEARKLRVRMSAILPLYNDIQAKTLTIKVNQMVARKNKNELNISDPSVAKHILRLYNSLGVLSRSHPHISKPLKALLRTEFSKTIKNPYY